MGSWKLEPILKITHSLRIDARMFVRRCRYLGPSPPAANVKRRLKHLSSSL